YISKRAYAVYSTLNKMAREMDALSDTIEWIEKGTFKSKYLTDAHAAIGIKNKKASQAIRQFKSILDRMDIRLNPLVFIPLNIFVLWDLQQVLALEKWKKEHAADIHVWFKTIATFEAVSSLAAIHFNHPEWVFPEFTDDHGHIESVALGHPLIP